MDDLNTMSAQELFDLYYIKSWDLVQAIKLLQDELPDEITEIAKVMFEANNQRLKLDN